jgi:hypothetical protein
MNLRHGTLRLLVNAAAFVCLVGGPNYVRGQQTPDKWERVHTGQEYIIEINVSHVKLEPECVLQAQFRTILSEPESLRGKPEAKYKTRLETIDFKLNERKYRFAEVTLLDPSGKVLQSYPVATQDWRVLKDGGITERLFDAARTLPPFGSWKTVTYRLADRETKPTTDLASLIGTRVRFLTDRAEVGAKICSSPAFQSKRFTKEELLREAGVDLKTIGIKADEVETINIKCEGSGWQPPYSVLIRTHEGEMLMLWDGVFLVLKRDGH